MTQPTPQNPMPSSRSAAGAISPATAGALLLLLVAGASLAGHEGSRAARVLAMLLPVFIWLRWPIRNPAWQLLRWVLVSLTLGMFVVDGVVRTYMLDRYQAVPESSLVLAAVANTTQREMAEYADAMGSILWIGLIGSGLALCAVFALTAISGRHQAPLKRSAQWWLIGILVVCTIAFAGKHWRRYHPVIYWSSWASSISNLRLSWANQENERALLLANAQKAKPQTTSATPSTVVLVISDSVNRDNMSLYGYGRATTPGLIGLSHEEAGKWLTLPHAWSTAAGTWASLSGVFSFGRRAQNAPVGESQHILAIARAAGYQVWWLSNHDDIAIEQQHAKLANTVEMINRQPGRGSASLDGALLTSLETALAHEAPKKLIVVHMLGTHPDYRRRAPSDAQRFDSGDEVDAMMVRDGRPLWLRETRQTYDSAMRYHDSVITDTVRLTRKHAPANGEAAWMYISDHGQEVGHSANRAGHSAATEAGYRIPALAWRSSAPFPADANKRPFRADWAGWMLADLMKIEWVAMERARNVLSDAYAWEAPHLPLEGVRFDR